MLRQRARWVLTGILSVVIVAVSMAQIAYRAPGGGPFSSVSFNGGSTLADNGSNKVELRNSTNPQLFSVCNTYTSSTSYECLALDWQSTGNTMRVWTTKGSGGGSYRSMVLAAGISSNITLGANEIMTFGNGSGNAWQLAANRNWLASTHNAFDIGTSTAASAPRTIYAGTSVVAPTINATSALQLNGVPLIIPAVCSNTSASTAVTTTSTETAFDVTCKITANTLQAGYTFRYLIGGVYSGNNTDTLIYKVKAGTVDGCASGTVTTLATTSAVTLTAATNQYWDLGLNFNVFTIGASGTIEPLTKGWVATTANTGTPVTAANTAAITLDTTVDQYICTTVKFSTNSANDSIRARLAQGVVQ